MMQFLLGVIVGVVVAGIAVWLIIPKLMLFTTKSRLNYDDTLAALQEESKKRGWNVPHVYDMKKSFEKTGATDVERMHVISLGNGKHAYAIVKNDEDKNILAMMPFRLGVFEDKKGDVYFTGANMGIMSKMFGGNVDRVMGGSAKELEVAFKNIAAS
jgi:uncharacterized protein (DUF302 family)